MRRTFFSLIILTSFLTIFSSCSPYEESNEIINLKDNFYWTECSADSTPEEAESLRFHKFSTAGTSNILKVAGREQEYVWLRLVFKIPENLKNKSLGLFISYLHFASKVWVNGTYVGSYGEFPPDEKSALWASHFYSIPEPILIPNERNTVLIKVYCKGKSGISDKILLGEYDNIKKINTFRTFLQSIVYIFAAGGMFFAALFFFMIFIWRKKEREYLSFALLCVSSLMLATPFYAPQLPITYPNNVPYLLFIKLTLCSGFYLDTFLLSSLMIEFVKRSETNFFRILRGSVLAICIIPTLFAPNYDFLRKVCPYTLLLSLVQILFGFIFILKQKLSPKELKDFKTLNFAFIPVLLAIPVDFIIKLHIQKADVPYITLFGWLLTILNFIIIMSVRYNKAVAQNEYLNIQLRREVQKQTQELSHKNSKLEEEIRRSELELDMASLVQKKFFPYPPKNLKGWDIAVSYNPLAKVSGDMYDYYIHDNFLYGFSLFDVSGHGISASLITMLAKNIVGQTFLKNMQNKETVSRTLYEINNEIIEAKGEVENYLTGVMFRFGEFDQNDECLVEMANAGHPNPILFSAKDMTCHEVTCKEGEDHHGAIGIDFITVSFPQVNFNMAGNDILFFYTDGLTEGRNKNNEMFGKDRVKNLISKNYAKDAQSIMEEIIDEFKTFTEGSMRDDDITIVVLKRQNSATFFEDLMEL